MVQFIQTLYSDRRLAMLFACALIVLGGRNGVAQEVAIPRTRHPWGRFDPGSWSQVRKVVEELDDDGNVRSTRTSETKTTLMEADNQSVTLLVEVTVEVAGRRMATKPKIVDLGYNGQADGETATMRRMGQESIEIGGQTVETVVLQGTVTGDRKKKVSTIHYSDRAAPYILRRETRTLDEHGQPTGGRTRVDVIALRLPHRVFTETKMTSHVRVLQSSSQGSSVTMEVHCEEIPGAVVAHSSTELDERGKPVRRSMLELIAYGIGDPEPNRFMGLRDWLRQKRARKASHSYGR